MFGFLLAVAGLSGLVTVLFGGEDPTSLDSEDDKNWHHRGLTGGACNTIGLDVPVKRDLQWHADMIDSYLYNPLWWVKGVTDGGMDRFKASAATRNDLAAMHFDDLTSTDQVITVWRRYLSGTVAGLLWASTLDVGEGIAAARNIVGVSLHAIQDFYSHSNWVDAPERRPAADNIAVTWFDFSLEDQEKMFLFTGLYEHPEHHGIKHHGKLSPKCSVLKQGPINKLMELAAAAYSPFQNMGAVEQWKRCDDAESLQPGSLIGKVPPDLVYLDPPGIALDSTWQAEIAFALRDVPDRDDPQTTPLRLFESATTLAEESSARWLHVLDGIMDQAGANDFWQIVKTHKFSEGVVDEVRTAQYEDYHRFPYMFLSTGPYPPRAQEPEDEWYLRVRLTTGAEDGAGTNANIYLDAEEKLALDETEGQQGKDVDGARSAFGAGGSSTLLDYSPDENWIVRYNDFEAGDNTAYMAGPFEQLPKKIALRNAATDAGDVLKALGVAFVDAVEGVVSGIGDFLLSLIGGQADHVQTKTKVWQPQQLEKLEENWVQVLDGKTEGRYRVEGTIHRTDEGSDQQLGEWAEYEVALNTLVCERESSVDRTSGVDEPFVLALLLSPASQSIQPFRTDAFEEVEAGVSREVNHKFERVRVPKGSAALVLPISVWESDDEGAKGRDKLLEEFAQKTEAETKSKATEFIDALGGAVASAWQLDHIEVFAFNRATHGRAGQLLQSKVGKWINAEEHLMFDLDHSELTLKWELPPTPWPRIHGQPDGGQPGDGTDVPPVSLRERVVAAATAMMAEPRIAAKERGEDGLRRGWQKLEDMFDTAAPVFMNQPGFREQTLKQGTSVGGNDGIPHWSGIFALWALKAGGADVGEWKMGHGIASVENVKPIPPDKVKPGDIGFVPQPFQHHFVVAGVYEDGTIDRIDGNSGAGSTVVLKERRDLRQEGDETLTYYSAIID